MPVCDPGSHRLHGIYFENSRINMLGLRADPFWIVDHVRVNKSHLQMAWQKGVQSSLPLGGELRVQGFQLAKRVAQRIWRVSLKQGHEVF